MSNRIVATRILAALMLATLLCACGKYGDPVRADAVRTTADAEVCEDEDAKSDAEETP